MIKKNILNTIFLIHLYIFILDINIRLSYKNHNYNILFSIKNTFYIIK
jgi:hypothetical protein